MAGSETASRRRAIRPRPQRDDAALARRARCGDPDAFAAIFRRYHPPLLSYCRHMLGNRDDGEDALQQTFIKAHAALLRGTSPRELRPWLYGIARNCCLDSLSTSKRRAGPVLDEHTPSLAGLSDEVLAREDLRELLLALSHLPVDQRSALLLSEVDDLDHQAIAGIVGCPVRKVKALIYQARSTLIAERDARNAPCREIREQLAVGRGGELRRGPLRRHVSLCTGCRDFQQALGAQRRSLAAILPVVPSPGLAAATLGHGAIHAAGAAGAGAGAASAGAGTTIGTAGTSAATGSSSAASASVASSTLAGAGAGGGGAGSLIGASVAAKVAIGTAIVALGAGGALASHLHSSTSHPQHPPPHRHYESHVPLPHSYKPQATTSPPDDSRRPRQHPSHAIASVRKPIRTHAGGKHGPKHPSSSSSSTRATPEASAPTLLANISPPSESPAASKAPVAGSTSPASEPPVSGEAPPVLAEAPQSQAESDEANALGVSTQPLLATERAALRRERTEERETALPARLAEREAARQAAAERAAQRLAEREAKRAAAAAEREAAKRAAEERVAAHREWRATLEAERAAARAEREARRAAAKAERERLARERLEHIKLEREAAERSRREPPAQPSNPGGAHRVL